MATIHNQAVKGEIAETILLPGDPLRAGYIAREYLENSVKFNSVRNMEGYTGDYKGKRISVMGTGIGCPSIGIYAYELIHEYGVKNLIRIGSCGGIDPQLQLGDLLLSSGASTDSSYLDAFDFYGNYSAVPSFFLMEKAVNVIRKLGYSFAVGNTFCSDVFYRKHIIRESWREIGILGTEMEAYALYCIAAMGRANALAMFTVTDNLVTGEAVTSKEREIGLDKMITAALETAVTTLE